MELIITVLCAFPIGWFVRRREVAFLVFLAIHQFVFNFQSMELVREWVGGDDSAFPKNPKTIAWSYGFVNLTIYVAGFGLVLLGNRLATRRRERRVGAVQLDA
jgi:hypothetical protein